jgi:hypothetical protein
MRANGRHPFPMIGSGLRNSKVISPGSESRKRGRIDLGGHAGGSREGKQMRAARGLNLACFWNIRDLDFLRKPNLTLRPGPYTAGPERSGLLLA